MHGLKQEVVLIKTHDACKLESNCPSNKSVVQPDLCISGCLQLVFCVSHNKGPFSKLISLVLAVP